MRRTIVFIFSLLYGAAAFAEPADSLWNRANRSYSEANYVEASALYEQILSESGESAELYFNLGNAYLKQNMIGQARLNYERALRLAPENEDILYNINFAKSLQMDKIDEVQEMFLTRWFNDAASLTSASGWSAVFFTLLALCLILLLVYFFTRGDRLRKLSFILACFALLLVAASFVLGNRRRHNQLKNDEAVIFAPAVTVKSSPNSSGSDLFIVHEGLKVKVLDNQEEWIRIILGDGKSQGWVPKSAAEVI
ncbi:MAG: tetratricopeptide repeat protein [Prevotellaceae bacterium]|nr:tetratricopeptide repeat protein [Prevotellaceae bacterium]